MEQPPSCGHGVQTEIQGLVGTPLCTPPRGSWGVVLLSPKVWNGCHGGEDLAIGIACFTTPPPLTGDQTHTPTHTHTSTTWCNYGGGIISPIAEGVRGGESWNKISIPNPTPPCAHLVPFSPIHILWRRLASKLLCWLDADRGERESGDWQTKILNWAKYLKWWRAKNWDLKSHFQPCFSIASGQATSPHDQVRD